MIYPFYSLQRTLTCCMCVCCLSLIAKVQFWYLGSPNITVPPWLVMWSCLLRWNVPNKSFLWSRRSTMTVAMVSTLHHLERWHLVCVFVGPDWHTQKVAIIGLGNSQTNRMKLALQNSLLHTGHFGSIINDSLKFSGNSHFELFFAVWYFRENTVLFLDTCT